MNKSARIKPPEKSIHLRIAERCACVCIVIFALWQGSYFPLQFLLMVALILIAFILFGKSLYVSKKAAFLFGISLLYIISLLILTENHYAGLIELLRSMIFPLTLILFFNTDPAKAEKAIFFALVSIAVLGLLAFASVIYIPGGMVEATNRLQSVIQYANTTALLMLIGILYSINAFIKDKKPAKLVYCLLFASAFFLTGSRTALVVALAVCFLYAMIMLKRRGKLITVGILVIAIWAIVSLNIFTDLRMFRISLHEPSLVERWITFQDAIGMMRGNWLLGIGTGNWQEWQFLYQSAPYHVKYIHNYYLQLLLDGGLLAPLLFLAATLPAIIKGVRTKSIHGFILIAMMLQALLDVDLIFAGVAMIAMFSLSQLTAPGKELVIGELRYIAIAPLLAVTVIWGSEVFSASADRNLTNGNLQASMSRNKTALRLNPLNTGLYFQMAQSTRDIALTEHYIRTGIERNPRDSRAISILARIEAGKGNYNGALDLCERLIESQRHSRDIQSLYLYIAGRAVNGGAISNSDFEEIQSRVDSIRLQANPLYIQFISRDENE